MTAFLADKDPDKRDKLVDRLLERTEYAGFGTNQWGDLVRVKRGGLLAAHPISDRHPSGEGGTEGGVSFDTLLRQAG